MKRREKSRSIACDVRTSMQACRIAAVVSVCGYQRKLKKVVDVKK